MNKLIDSHLEALAARIDFSAGRVEPQASRTLVWAAGLSLTVALLAWALWGYHAGFATLNGIGAHLPGRGLQSLTYMGDSLFALVMMLIFARRYPHLLWTAVVAALIAALASRGVKELFDAVRPAGVLMAGSFHLEGPRYRAHSFPSGHAVTAFVMAATFACYLPALRARLIALAVAALVALSRVWVGAHWPIDLAVGAAVGCASVLLAGHLVRTRHWGMRLRGHLIMAGLLCGCTLAMAVLPLPYPKAEPLARTVAVLALGIAGWNYALAPQLLLRGRSLRRPWLRAVRVGD